MKYIISIIVMTLFVTVAVSCNKTANHQHIQASKNNDTKEIPADSLVQNLPQLAKDFIKEFLLEKEVARVSSNESCYIVWLSSGEKMEFDLQGNFKEIEAPGGVPDTVVDERIIKDVKALNPNIFIMRMEKNSYGYVVKLSNGSEVKYDANCQRMEAEYD